MWIIDYFPAVLFALVGGAMNLSFAATLGSDATTTYLWQALSIGATVYTIRGADLALRAYRAGERARCAAAVIVLSLSLCYDVMAAYGFAKAQMTQRVAEASQDTQRARSAQLAVQSARRDLEPYLDAPDISVAKATLEALQDQLENTRRPVDRASLQQQITVAKTTVARAEAKDRLSKALKHVEATVGNISLLPVSADPRVDLFGEAFIEWLPVALITIGGLLGFFAVTPTATAPKANSSTEPREAAKLSSSSTASTASTDLPATEDPVIPAPGDLAPLPPVPVSPSPATPLPPISPIEPSATATHKPRKPANGYSLVARRLAELESGAARLPTGLEREGPWFRGSQRTLAALFGLPAQSQVNRVLHKAKQAGEIELDTSGRKTAIKLTSVNEDA